MRWLNIFLFVFVCLFECRLTRFGRAEIFFHETFDTLENWVQSLHRDDYGKVGLESGNIVGNGTKQQGLKLLEGKKHYALSRKLPFPIKPTDKPLVVSFSVKNEHNLKCGGTYIKLLPEDFDPKNFSNSSTHLLLFGTDRCGNSSYMRIEKLYKGKVVQWPFKDPVPEGPLTYFHTIAFNPDNTYTVYLNGAFRFHASIERDWKLLPPPLLIDPTVVKPLDWDDRAVILDPTMTRPADWDESQPTMIRDDNAKPPPNYDEALQGPWIPPLKRNPLYKGRWIPRYISNPNYKGPWIPKRIPNPEYTPDPTLYQLERPIGYVGIELWTVEEGSIFDDIMIGDNQEEILRYIRTEVQENLQKEEAMLKLQEDEKQRLAERHKQDVADATRVYKALEQDNGEDL